MSVRDQLPDSISSMEPMIPQASSIGELGDRVFDLVHKASAFAGSIAPVTASGVGDLVRSMNCYYSNLIEGHHTHPLAIDSAMEADYSENKEQRDLQLEARAHIEVQRAIDAGAYAELWRVSQTDFLRTIHREFCKRLPDDLLVVDHPKTGDVLSVVPGEFRTHEVQVGRHIPPSAALLPRFMVRFEEAYTPARLTKIEQVVAVAASHHRFAWIHPFLDGNGRVGRLFSHAWLKELGVGNTLWSVSRGLARSVSRYKALLQAADQPRRGDRDGRGALSERALLDFCAYFLETCVDQVSYMEALLKPDTFVTRLEIWCERQVREGRLADRSFPVLREAFIAGTVDRRRMPELTGYQDRKARDVMYKLVDQKLLVADSARGPLRLGFPIGAAMEWFPKLYPEDPGSL